MKLIINDVEAEAIRMIFKMYLLECGYSEIIDYLKSNGFRTKRGSLFGKNSLFEILRNEKHCGMYTYNKSVSKNIDGKFNRHKSKDEKDIIRIDGGLSAIVSKEDFAAAQEKMKKRKNTTAKFTAKQDYLLSGKIVCGICGSSYIGNSIKRSVDGSIKIGVAMPNIPSYFWNSSRCGINDFVNKYESLVSVVYSYYSDLSNKKDVQYCLNYLLRQELDAYIIVPDESGYAAEILKDFKKPFGLLNRNYDLDNKLFYVGADYFEEGKKQGEIAKFLLKDKKDVAIIFAKPNNQRVDGFRFVLHDCNITEIEIDFKNKLSPSRLAQKLSTIANVDLIYVTEGYMSVTAKAIHKLNNKEIILIGHECSKEDERLVLDKSIHSYVKQDPYLQGSKAIENLINYLINQKEIENKEQILISTVYLGG